MSAVTASPRKLQTAEDRREDVLRAAMQEFARRGYYGTPTTDIAKGAGISQAYLFRLFPTKEELFVACVERTYRSVHDEFAKAAAPARRRSGGRDRGDGRPRTTSCCSNSDLLLCQLHGYAACQEPAIRVAVRQGYKELVELVQHLSGAPDEEIQRFFADRHAHQRRRRHGRPGARRALGPALMTDEDCS